MTSTRLTPGDYLAHLRTESERFHVVLSQCEPRALVPSCPAWQAADLVWHLTEVQDFWRHVIDNRPSPPKDYADPTRPEGYPALLAAFAETSAAFIDRLGQADPGEHAWSWSGEQSVGFTYRRQALEALVHRVDAEQAAGLSSTLDPALAADGVDEVLDIFYGGKPAWGTFSGLPHYLRVDITDTGHSLWVQLGRISGERDGEHIDDEDFAVVPTPGVEPDAVLSGTAVDLLLRIWRRADGDRIRIAGDHAIIDRFRRLIHAPLD